MNTPIRSRTKAALKALAIITAAGMAAACKKGPAGDAPKTPTPPAATAQAGDSRHPVEELCHQIRYSDDADAVAKVLDQGVDVNSRDKSGLTPLIMALMQGSGGSDEMQARIVDLLLERGADPNLNCPLCAAIQARKPALAQKLLDKGADVNGSDPSGNTPLIEAVNARLEDLLPVLLDRGADTARKDAHGRTAWKAAFDQAYTYRTPETLKIEEMLRARSSRADIEALLRADNSLKGYLDVDKWLQEHP